MPGDRSLISRVMLVAAVLMPAGHATSAHASDTQVYASRCASCHKADGAGVPGQFPRLKGRVGVIAASKEGRSYLIAVVLYGMFGAIDVDGRTIRGMMPPMGSLSDQDVADTLNASILMEKPKKKVALFTAAEVKDVRAAGRLSAAAVAKQRAQLAAKGLIP